jgi:hypothetical protein
MTRPLAVFADAFDPALAPVNMQEHAYIPDARGVTTKLFDAPS